MTGAGTRRLRRSCTEDDAGLRGRATRVTAGVSFAAQLAFENISHAFGPDAETLNDVTLTAEPGEVLCLLGPVRLRQDDAAPDRRRHRDRRRTGRVLLNDREIAGPSVFLPPEQRSIGLVFQDFALFPHLSILDNVRFGLTALSREEARREAHDLAGAGRAGGLRRRPIRTSCPAASSSASRSPARWRRVRRCC